MGDLAQRGTVRKFGKWATTAIRHALPAHDLSYLQNFMVIGAGDIQTVPGVSSVNEIAEAPVPNPCPGCGLIICPLLKFPCTASGAASDPLTATITNADTADITIGTIQSDSVYFVPDLSGITLPYLLAAGSTLAVPVVFYPGAASTYVGHLIVASDGLSSPDYVLMAGTSNCDSSCLKISPALPIHTENSCDCKPSPFVIFNDCNTPQTIHSITMNQTAGWSLIDPGLPELVLAPGAIYVGAVQFCGASDPTTRTVTIISSAPSSPDSFVASASGSYGTATVIGVSGCDFGAVQCGGTCPQAPTQFITFRNLGPELISITDIDSPSPFASNYVSSNPPPCKGGDGLITLSVDFACTGPGGTVPVRIGYRFLGGPEIWSGSVLVHGTKVPCPP